MGPSAWYCAKLAAFSAFPTAPLFVIMGYYADVPWLVAAFAFIGIPVLDLLIGPDGTEPLERPAPRIAIAWLRTVPRLYAFLWPGMLTWAAHSLASEAAGPTAVWLVQLSWFDDTCIGRARKGHPDARPESYALPSNDSRGEVRNPEVIGVQHVKTGQDQHHSPGNLERFLRIPQDPEVFKPPDRCRAQDDGNRTPESEGEQQQHAEQWRPDACGDPEKYDKGGRARRADRDGKRRAERESAPGTRSPLRSQRDLRERQLDPPRPGEPHDDQERPEHQAPLPADDALHPGTAEPRGKPEHDVRQDHAENEHRSEQHGAPGFVRFGHIGKGNGNRGKCDRVEAE